MKNFNNFECIRAIVLPKMKKVIMVIKTGRFNLTYLLLMILKLSVFGETSFSRLLYLALKRKFIKVDELSQYRLLIIISLKGQLESVNGVKLPVREERFSVDLQARIDYNILKSLDESWRLFYSQVESDFNEKTKYTLNSRDEYYFQKIVVKIIFEKRD